MKKFVKMQSTMNIQVTSGLQSIDMSNKDAHVADRLNVKSAWVGTKVLIKQGTGFYPSEIKAWNSVKMLADKNIITIGSETDECENQAEVEKVRDTLLKEKARYKKLEEDTKKDPLLNKEVKAEVKF